MGPSAPGDAQAGSVRRSAKIGIPGDEDRLVVIDLQRSCEMYCVIAAQAVLLGKRAGAASQLFVEAKRDQPALQILEVGKRPPMILPAEAACAFSSRQRRPSLRIGEDARSNRAGTVPELGCRVRALLDDYELDERRGVEVEDQRRCSATRSETGPAPFTRAR